MELRERIRWLRDEGMAYFGMWEPIYFQKMRGGVTDAQLKAYDFIHTEEWIKHLAEEGINHVWTHFYKGYGLQFEHDDMERNREMAQICHEHEMRVIAYCTFGSLTRDTILLEEPDAENWFQRNEMGRYTPYQSYQSFRVRPCYNSAGWREYMKRVTSKALDMGLDGIHFDNIGYLAEPETCKCDTCKSLFRKYLADKYSGTPEKEALGMERFGMTDFSRVSLPWFTRFNEPINQKKVTVTIQQEWTNFKIHSLTNALIDLAEHIRSVKPDALVEANAGKAIGCDLQLWSGISPEDLYHHLDIIFNESGGVSVNDHDALVCRVREYKLARNSSVPAIMYSHTPAELAETLAFNQGCVAGGGNRQFREYFHRVKKYVARTETLSETAVLYHSHTMRYNWVQPYESFISITQMLLEDLVPFDIIHSRELDDLSKYRLVILPDVECLSDEEAQKLIAFVENGDSLLATENTGRFDNWYRKRVHREIDPKSVPEYRDMMSPRNALSELFGDDPREPMMNKVGKGRAGFLPVLEYVERMGSTPDVWMYFSRYYAAPRNSDEIRKALSWLHREPSVYAEGSGRLLFEPLRVIDTGQTVLNVVDIDPHGSNSVSISITLPEEPQTVLRIDQQNDETPLKADYSDGRLSIQLNDLKHHNLVVIE